MHAFSMNSWELGVGHRVQLANLRKECEIGPCIADGTQGRIFEGTLEGRAVALKWMKPMFATPQHRSHIERLVGEGAPDRRLLWPIDVAVCRGSPGFGYVMPFREARFRPLTDLMHRRVDPTMRAVVTAALEVADIFAGVHSRGLCYGDISLNNIAFDPRAGEVCVCDNDNVGVSGATGSQVQGTPHFMAPELLRGGVRPNTSTDLHAIAVLFFYMFLYHHPLHGRREAEIDCLDERAIFRLEAEQPLFIFDPVNRSNRPVPGLQANPLTLWPIYPLLLTQLFTQAFTTGLTDPVSGRVTCTQWRQGMISLRDAIFSCSHCRKDNFYDQARINGTARPWTAGTCWSCSKQLRVPPRLRLGKQVVVLDRGTPLYPHHLDARRRFDFSAPVAVVQPSPRNPKVLTLQNVSSRKWVVCMAHGTVMEVIPGRYLPFIAEAKVYFGNCDGELRL